MTQMKLELDEYSMRVLDVVKGIHGLKNRNDAFRKFVHENGDKYVPIDVREDVIQKLDLVVSDHVKKYGERKMTDDELDDLLGL